jgi:hypothetical protein
MPSHYDKKPARKKNDKVSRDLALHLMSGGKFGLPEMRQFAMQQSIRRKRNGENRPGKKGR